MPPQPQVHNLSTQSLDKLAMDSSTAPPLNDSSRGSQERTRLEIGNNDLRILRDHENPESQGQEPKCSDHFDLSSPKQLEESTYTTSDKLETVVIESSTTPPSNGSSLSSPEQVGTENGSESRISRKHEASADSEVQESRCSDYPDPSSPNKLAESTDSTDQALREATQRGEFLGDDDAEDPLNWPVWKKTYHSLSVSFYCFCVTFGSSVYTPGVFGIEKEFHVSSTVALLGLSLFILGFAFGPMIAAPISERYGRRVVYWASLPFFAAFTLGSALAPNYVSLAVFRFLSAVFGSPPLSVGAGTNADLFRPSSRALATGMFVLAPFIGPALGPVIGGYVAQVKGWRWTQWTQLFFAGAAFIVSSFMSETYKKTIIKKRAKRLGVVMTETEAQGMAKAKMLFTVILFRPLKMLYTEPIVTLFSIYVAFNFSVVYVFFDSFPIVFGGVYHFSLGEIGLTFLGLGFGCVLAIATFIGVDRITYQKLYQKSLREGRKGVVAPEHRLYSAMVGSLGMPIGLFWAAWTSRADIHWISPVLAAIPFGWGNLSVFCSVVLYLVDAYGMRNGASALAANGLLRYIVAPAFPLFTIQMYRNLGIAWATSTFAFITVALMPIPFVLFKWGPAIRNRSLFTLKDFEEEKAAGRSAVNTGETV